MSDPLADPADLASFWRPLTDAETAVAASLITVASALIRRRFKTIDQDLVAGTKDGDIVRYVIAEMIKSAVDGSSRPVDAQSTSETVGIFSKSTTFAAAAARLSLSEDLVSLLGGESTAGGIGSARLGAPDHYVSPRPYRFPEWSRYA